MSHTSDTVSVTTPELHIPPEDLTAFSASVRQVYETLKPLLGGTYTDLLEARKLSIDLRALSHQIIRTLEAISEDSEVSIHKTADIVALDSDALECEEAVKALALQVNEALDFVRDCTRARNKARFDSFKAELAKIRHHSVPNATERQALTLSVLQEQETGILGGEEIAPASRDVGESVMIDTGDETFKTIAERFIAIMTTILGSKIDEKLDNRIDVTQQKQQVCTAELSTTNKFSQGTRSIWAEFDQCDDWWLKVDDILHLPDAALNYMERAHSSPEPLKSDLRVRLMMIMNTLEQFREEIKRHSGEAPSFPTLFVEGLNNEHTLKGEVQVFERHIQMLVPLLMKLSTAQYILHQGRDKALVIRLYKLRQCLLTQLQAIQEAFGQWTFYLKQGSVAPFSFTPEISAMMRGTDQFTYNIQPIIAELGSILNDHVDKRKVKNARQKQKENEKTGMDCIVGQRIGSKDEALETLNQLGRILSVITRFPTELGIALLYHDCRPQAGNLLDDGIETDLMSAPRPKDPFNVDQKVISSAAAVLEHEAINLDVRFRPLLFKKGL